MKNVTKHTSVDLTRVDTEGKDVIKDMLHNQIDVLEQTLIALEDRLQTVEKALYIACSDYYSTHYPNGHRSVDEIYDDYLKAAMEDDD